MIDFKVFKNYNYCLSSMVNFLLGVALFSGSFFYSLFCGSVLHYEPLDIGLLFLKGSFIQIIMMPLVGKIVPHIDGRFLVLLGISLVTLSIYFNSSLTQMTTEFDLIEVLFIRSLGLAFVFIPLSVMAVAQCSPKELGNAVGLFNLTRELGGSIGLAVMSSGLINHIQMYDSHLRTYYNSGNPVLHHQINLFQSYFYGSVLNPQKAAHIMMQNKIDQQSTILSFNLCFFLLSMFFLGSIFIVFMLKKLTKEESEAKVDGMH